MNRKQRQVFNESDAKNLVYAVNNFKIKPILPETKKKFNKLVKKINILKEDILNNYYAILRPALVKILEHRELIKKELGDNNLYKLNFVLYNKITTTNSQLRNFDSIEDIINFVETNFHKIDINSPINLEEYNKLAREFNEKLKNIVLNKDSSEKLSGVFYRMNGLNNLMRRKYTEDIEVVDVISNKSLARRKEKPDPEIEKILELVRNSPYNKVRDDFISTLDPEEFNKIAIEFNSRLKKLEKEKFEANKGTIFSSWFKMISISKILKRKYPDKEIEDIVSLNNRE